MNLRANPYFILAITAFCFMALGCSDIKKKENPITVIFDTDMGSDCDDAGALALLHHYEAIGKAKIAGCIYSSGKVPYGAAIIDAINHYYGRPEIPTGASHDTLVGDPVDKMSAEKLARDTAAYLHTIIHNTDAIRQTVLNRKLLSQAEDKSIVYITVGHTRGLYELLKSAPDSISPLNGHQLVEKKIKKWVALGALNADNKEGNYVRDWNFSFNGTAPYTKYLVDNFPGTCVFINAGSDIYTGKSLIATPAGNIVRTAYRDWLWNTFQQPLEHQRPSWDLAAVYYAIEDTGAFLQYTSPGRLLFDSLKGSKWQALDEHTNHRYVVQKDNVKEAFEKFLNQRIVKE